MEEHAAHALRIMSAICLSRVVTVSEEHWPGSLRACWVYTIVKRYGPSALLAEFQVDKTYFQALVGNYHSAII
jgi:hypothetical protein